MRVPELAARVGLPARTVRFYADQGLIRPARRLTNRHREFDDEAVRRLRFVRKAQTLGMTLAETGALLRAAERMSCGQSSELVRRRLQRQLAVVDDRVAELQSLQHELRSLLRPEQAECTDELCLCQERRPSEASRSRS